MTKIPMKRFIFKYKVNGEYPREWTVDHFDVAHAWEAVLEQIAQEQQITPSGVYVTDVTCIEEDL